MYPKKKCSFKHNKSSKSTQFKKGHPYLPKVKTDAGTVIDSNEEGPQRIVRPSLAEFSDACFATESTKSQTLPSKLRPVIKANNFELGLDQTNSEENIVVNLNKLSDLVSLFQHDCRDPSAEVKIESRKGLCVTSRVQCKTCNFISDACQLFTSIEKAQGHKSGTLNDALAIPILKSKMGANDICYLLSCMNIKPPAISGIQKKVSKLADHVIQLNKESMSQNQRYIRRIKQMAGEEPLVNVETDTAYNNRPQAGFEAATQSFCPVISQDTRKKLVVSMETANKLCTKRNCNHKNTLCRQNFCTADSISSSESKLVRKNLEAIESKGIIRVKSVTCDASTQVEKSIRDYATEKGVQIEHYRCFVHKLRLLQKHLKNVKLTTKLEGCNKEAFLLTLSIAIRARVRLELVRTKKVYPKSAQFTVHGQTAINNILSCFSGNHDNCREHSLVCLAHLPQLYKTDHLPYGKHIELNQKDISQLNAVLDKTFSRDDLRKVSRLPTTNGSECLHHMVFTYAPKSTIWSRNFAGLCHSAVHSNSLGAGKSSLAIASSIGIKYKANDPICTQMRKLDATRAYHSLRRRTKQYKLSRHLSRKRKSCKKILNQSLYENATQKVANEHAYGININK